VNAGAGLSRDPARGYLLAAAGAALAIANTLEPVLAAVFAWWLHDERLALLQLAAGGLVPGAVLWVQSHRPDLEAELTPPRDAR
jgi:drug/metabolite transporter (DMT)-like permease